ncbi:methyltransferase [Flavihumibacter sp. ZG627]|uniref:class I SAM-dependent methyltransferase n=1 Tax=Flavihumibacter sp. ZG627 TaxID=1463156 RepID=UPI00057E99F8|nr:methyltransferase domain-containing protein [Flavihumibacter sp. ZG627]KIC90483.1 hypothetical protein HY58_11045 [Flavihumibacter sp. ZG627]
MHYPLYLRRIDYGSFTTEIFMPDEEEVKKIYKREKSLHPDIDFPFWTRLWPSAIALSIFLRENEEMVSGKTVLELGAGLGLPSVVAAAKALRVTGSDYIEAALETMVKSFSHHGFRNANSVRIDVKDYPEGLYADIVLLSDVNYDPGLFPGLIKLLDRFLENGSTIILSTPQRIMASAFIESLLTKIKSHQLFGIKENNEAVRISVFVFGTSPD